MIGNIVEEERRGKLTRAKLEALGFKAHKFTPNILVYYGRNARKEYIEAFFNDSTENQVVPNQINIVGLNNDATIGEDEDMDFEHFTLALWLVYGDTNFDDPMSMLMLNLSLDIECKAKYK